jgi:hypothetical protein
MTHIPITRHHARIRTKLRPFPVSSTLRCKVAETIFIIMIQLKRILQEISLSGALPYATQFAWTETQPEIFQVTVTCDGVPVQFNMVQGRPGAYSFSYTFASRTTPGESTTSHHKSMGVGQVSYLRVLATAAEAVMDFAAQHAPQYMDIGGVDVDVRKARQKTLIYRDLLAHNATKLSQLGYRVTRGRTGHGLILQRIGNADVTGTSTS